MRRLILLLWLLLPVGGLAYHMGPGQDRLRLDDAGAWIARGEEHAQSAAALAETDEGAARADWASAEEAFAKALSLLPTDRVATRRAVRLERARARMFISQLPEANSELDDLVSELEADPAADPEVLREARRALASSQYYVTWLMRLEGRGRGDWEPEIEVARQLYKLLEDEAAERGDEQARQGAREDLEAAVRLARMDLDELQGLPLPSQ